MEQQDKPQKNKGGRPVKKIRKDQLLGVKCTNYERRIIEAKARKASLSVSEYLCEMGKNGKVNQRLTAIPKEILETKAELRHISAYLNQLAKKRNSNEELTAQEEEVRRTLYEDLKRIANKIDKAYA